MPQGWIGKTIGGRYQIDSLLGQGGMSAVYRATDPNLRRQVAIKLIHTHLSVNPNFVNRFKEEAAAVARLRHPNIVQVHDFNNDGDTFYMVMEYLIGETLQARLRRLNAVNRYLPFPDVIDFTRQLCDAIGYAHKHELIHRDIKPANIMLDMNGRAILMDFGIVKIIGGEYHTATGATVGTAMYMAPEQIRSERADERSDIYSLGVTLYEMIGRQTPYQADSALTLMMMVLNDPLPDLRSMRKRIPATLLDVVEKALAKEPKDRFQTMEEMAAALQPAEDQLAGIAPLVTVADEEEPERASLADEEAEVPTQSLASPAEEAPEEAVRSAEPASSAPPPVSLKEPRGLSTSAVSTVVDPASAAASAPQPTAPSRTGAKARRNDRRIIIAAALLLLLAVAALAGVYYLQAQQAPALQTMPIEQPVETINAQSARYVVTLGQWETGSVIEELDFAPDGKRIGTANNREAVRFAKYRFYGELWRLDTGALQNYLVGHTQWVNGAAFSPDGRLFATASDDGNLLLWQVADGRLVRQIETSTGGLASLAFSPSSLLVAAGSWNSSVGLWQVSDGQLLRKLTGHEDGVTDVAFSPDGEFLASASDDLTIKLWQVSDGSLVQTLSGHTAPIQEVTFSPDGLWLASASDDRSVRIWQVADGSLVRTLEGHSEPVLDVAFSPDGSLLASGSADVTLRLWRAADGELLQLLGENSDAITSLAFSPDGRMLVSGQLDGLLRFWGLSEAIPSEPQSTEN